MCAIDLDDPTNFLPGNFCPRLAVFWQTLLPNGFITRKLVNGKIWNIFSAIILTSRHATVISVRHDCMMIALSPRSPEVGLYTRGLFIIYGKLLRQTNKVSLRFLLRDTLHEAFFTGHQEGNIVNNFFVTRNKQPMTIGTNRMCISRDDNCVTGGGGGGGAGSPSHNTARQSSGEFSQM